MNETPFYSLVIISLQYGLLREWRFAIVLKSKYCHLARRKEMLKCLWNCMKYCSKMGNIYNFPVFELRLHLLGWATNQKFRATSTLIFSQYFIQLSHRIESHRVFRWVGGRGFSFLSLRKCGLRCFSNVLTFSLSSFWWQILTIVGKTSVVNSNHSGRKFPCNTTSLQWTLPLLSVIEMRSTHAWKIHPFTFTN